MIHDHALASERNHGDDTTLPVLAKTSTTIGRLWTSVLDKWPFGVPAAPSALFIIHLPVAASIQPGT